VYYLYSLKGFQPCYYFNFSEKYDVKFKLKCQIMDETGFIIPDKENVGYKYSDVIEQDAL
jgi:hypothetical protein